MRETPSTENAQGRSQGYARQFRKLTLAHVGRAQCGSSCSLGMLIRRSRFVLQRAISAQQWQY
jgi:hypothetical protein